MKRRNLLRMIFVAPLLQLLRDKRQSFDPRYFYVRFYTTRKRTKDLGETGITEEDFDIPGFALK